ncbi:MAG: hypothetical protein HPY90_12130 [Syntrophothermus sp.]|uniref:hypothetical protein n=1 Tax=Syntrophothermus sp. TaxID=2736299 RepID=UPI00257B16DA|nr:hypothetical protein [Syntrophothermus sp.]NSW83997.1 hypothetical protein [Syntrophothermus sp.]
MSFYLIVTGLSISTTAVLYLIFKTLQGRADPVRRVYLSAANEIRQRTAGILEKPKSRSEDRPIMIGTLIGFTGGLMLAWGAPQTHIFCLAGALIGYAGAKIYQRSVKDKERFQKMRELAVLAETVEFLSAVKYTIPQSFQFAAALMPKLKPLVDRCVARWPAGPERALGQFAEEVNLPEAAVLSSVLIHAQESGMEYVQKILQEESRSLEMLRRTLAEVKIVSKPMYFAIYRGLPLLAIGGILAGPLVYRVVQVLQVIMGGP